MWHDLRKNPNDLPELIDDYSQDVLIAVRYRTDEPSDPVTYCVGYFSEGEWLAYMPHDFHCIGRHYPGEFDMYTGDKVIAWKEIEEFNI